MIYLEKKETGVVGNFVGYADDLICEMVGGYQQMMYAFSRDGEESGLHLLRSMMAAAQEPDPDLARELIRFVQLLDGNTPKEKAAFLQIICDSLQKEQQEQIN